MAATQTHAQNTHAHTQAQEFPTMAAVIEKWQQRLHFRLMLSDNKTQTATKIARLPVGDNETFLFFVQLIPHFAIHHTQWSPHTHALIYVF